MDHEVVNLSWGAVERRRLASLLDNEIDQLAAVKADNSTFAWNPRRFFFHAERPGVLWVSGHIVARLANAEVISTVNDPEHVFRALYQRFLVERLCAAENREEGDTSTRLSRQALLIRAMSILAAKHAGERTTDWFEFAQPTELREIVRLLLCTTSFVLRQQLLMLVHALSSVPANQRVLLTSKIEGGGPAWVASQPLANQSDDCKKQENVKTCDMVRLREKQRIIFFAVRAVARLYVLLLIMRSFPFFRRLKHSRMCALKLLQRYITARLHA